jgi:hypothetical protein
MWLTGYIEYENMYRAESSARAPCFPCGPASSSAAFTFPEPADRSLLPNDELDRPIFVDVQARRPHRHRAPIVSAVIVDVEAGGGTTIPSGPVSPDPRVRRSGPAGRRRCRLARVTHGLEVAMGPAMYMMYI